jgi:hypothetical protein
MKFLALLSATMIGIANFTIPLPAMARVLDCEVNGASVSPNNGSTTKGVTGLMRCIERDTRLIAREQALVNGTYVGTDKFYENGKLIRDGNMKAPTKPFRPAAYC